MKLVNKEYRKTITKLSKATTNQTNKLKIYTESKVANQTLQLDIIKRHILPKKCSQSYEIKILNFEKHDEQLNLTRSSIMKRII